MGEPYKGASLSIFQALDELISAGRTDGQASAELEHALVDGALTLSDPHPEPAQSSTVFGWVIEFLRAFPSRRKPNVMVGAEIYVPRLRIARPQFEQVFGLNDTEPAAVPTGEQSKGRGRRPDFNWHVIYSEAIRLMDHHGDFDPADEEWDAQARLEEALKAFCQEKWQREPGTTTLRDRLGLWLPEWRANKRT